jgi:hypothetical protein
METPLNAAGGEPRTNFATAKQSVYGIVASFSFLDPRRRRYRYFSSPSQHFHLVLFITD